MFLFVVISYMGFQPLKLVKHCLNYLWLNSLQILEQVRASLQSSEEKRQASITELSAKHQMVKIIVQLLVLQHIQFVDRRIYFIHNTFVPYSEF